jgi:hypothetical protein
VPTREIRCAASSLVARLLDAPEAPLVEVARTRLSVHYETTDPRVPVLTVCSPSAVRLPAAIVTATLPGPGPATLGLGRLRQRSLDWRVGRWWRAPRPAGLVPPGEVPQLWQTQPERSVGVPLPLPAYDDLRPAALIGRGPGLTPSGDDVVAGALVAAYATSDPRLRRWRGETLAALGTAKTTAVSRALLHHACDGYATPELAEFVAAVCSGDGVARARARLLAVGHVSGAALMIGALHSLTTHQLEGAA